MTEETSLWKGSPSQWLNIWHFAITIVMAVGIVIAGFVFPPAFAALAIPAGYMIWRYLVVRTQVFEISELGLAEMTRKRIGEGLLESLSSSCPHCEGRGHVIDSALAR